MSAISLQGYNPRACHQDYDPTLREHAARTHRATDTPLPRPGQLVTSSAVRTHNRYAIWGKSSGGNNTPALRPSTEIATSRNGAGPRSSPPSARTPPRASEVRLRSASRRPANVVRRELQLRPVETSPGGARHGLGRSAGSGPGVARHGSAPAAGRQMLQRPLPRLPPI